MGLPSFQIIGAPGSGVKTLRDWLGSHPQVFLPEPGGEDHYATDLENRLEDRAIYFSRFAKASKDHRSGEWSTSYLYSGDAIPKIVDQAPLTRFIVCLEDPAEVFWHMYRSNRAKGVEKTKDPKSALSLSYARRQGRGLEEGIDPKVLDYTGMCSVGAQIARLMTHVPSAQILFVFREDMASEPGQTLVRILSFLELAPVDNTSPPLLQRRALSKLRFLPPKSGDLAREITSAGLRRLRLRRLADNAWFIPSEPPIGVRRAISDLLSEDIATLSVLTGRNLMDWVH